ncbi:MAG: prepilin-type N-terminal cleavage/methylation domain-containing protein [Candidatus Krumholzibacteriia bacterium]
MTDRRPSLDRRGMSIVEMMIALSMFGVIMGVVFTFMTNSRDSYTSTSKRAEYQQSVRAVISLLTREIRSAGCDATNAGLERFGVADHAQIRVRMDLDGNGDTLGTNPDEDISWAYDSGTGELRRDAGTGAITVLRGVSDVNFRYFQADGAELLGTPLSAMDRALVRFVDVEIVGATATGEEISYQTRVLVRNG